MKQKLLLLLFICSFSFVTANPKKLKTVGGPAIGLLMSSEMYSLGQVNFTFRIKNIGTETLSNIYITELPNEEIITFDSETILILEQLILEPGEETGYLHGYRNSSYTCQDFSQTMVYASTIDNIEVTDLSSDPNGYLNGEYGTYFNDIVTNSYYYNEYTYGIQETFYQDLNNNMIVDVGDAIEYNYIITTSNYQYIGEIGDNNAIVDQNTLTGIHFITQEEIDFGYVYNSASVSIIDYCDNYIDIPFYGTSCFNCPNPNGQYCITNLNGLEPHKISGTVKFNNNNDECNTGVNFPYRRIKADDGNYDYITFTNSNNGEYKIIIPNNSNNYSLTALENLSANFTSNPAAVNVNTIQSATPIDYNNNNFCISVISNYADLSVSLYNTNIANPGNTANYIINIKNNGTTSLNGSVDLTFDNNKLIFISAVPTQNSMTSNTISWNYSNLLPFESRLISLNFNVQIPPVVNANDVLSFTVFGNPITGDINTTNNTYNLNQIVRNSFDPNDKTVMEGEYIEPSQGGDYLTYLTRFQNTGTANATTVVIKETLDSDLDWNTFEPITSSHDANIQLRNGNDLTYTFSNIDLAYESANEPASHGWMIYKIKPKNTFAIGDIASSTSDIYFDYNMPIITNTVTTEMVALSINDLVKNNFSIYPNPASTYFMIDMQSEVEAQYQIFDINGKILKQDFVENEKPISISSLQKGFYFISIKTNQGIATYKLVKN